MSDKVKSSDKPNKEEGGKQPSKAVPPGKIQELPKAEIRAQGSGY